MNKPLSNVIPLRDEQLPRSGNTASGGELFQGLIGEAPTCPAWLSSDAKKHFRDIVKQLTAAGLIAKIDQGALAILATSYARMKEAETQMQEHGEFQETPNGYQQLAPWAIAWDRHSKQYEKLCVKFGITVAGRQRLRMENPNQGSLEL